LGNSQGVDSVSFPERSQGVTLFSDIAPGSSMNVADTSANRVNFNHPSSMSGSRFDLVDDEMLDIHRKFRAFVTYLQNETGFMNALTADLLWKSLYVKYEQCFVKL
jgi:seryl-tRNA synthetase